MKCRAATFCAQGEGLEAEEEDPSPSLQLPLGQAAPLAPGSGDALEEPRAHQPLGGTGCSSDAPLAQSNGRPPRQPGTPARLSVSTRSSVRFLCVVGVYPVVSLERHKRLREPCRRPHLPSVTRPLPGLWPRRIRSPEPRSPTLLNLSTRNARLSPPDPERGKGMLV